MSVKIIHCADVHLGANPKMKNDVLSAFLRIIDISKNYDFLLVSGDLFDNPVADRETVEIIKAKLSETPATVVICSGNHDYFSGQSPYNSKWPENVILFTGAMEKFIIREKNTCIHGAGFSNIYEPETLFSPEAEEDMINICVIHGDIGVSGEYNPISQSALSSSKMDYVALGHIHKRSDILKEGNTSYAYPGCPQGQGFDETGEKGVYHGAVDIGKCNLEFMKICGREFREIAVDITGLSSLQEVSQKISPYLEQDHFYKIILKGEIPSDFSLNTDSLSAILSSQAHFIKFEDRTTLSMEDIERIADEKSLKGFFVKNMLEKIREDNSDTNINALKLGLKAFSSEVDYEN